MRVGLFIVSAFVASTGAALAQSDWVHDPWSVPPAKDEPSITTAVEASQGALAPRAEYDQHREWLDERSSELTDPWTRDASPAPGMRVVLAHPVPERAKRESGEWAKPVPLLVDPWAAESARSSAPVIELIVDPWALE